MLHVVSDVCDTCPLLKEILYKYSFISYVLLPLAVYLHSKNVLLKNYLNSLRVADSSVGE